MNIILLTWSLLSPFVMMLSPVMKGNLGPPPTTLILLLLIKESSTPTMIDHGMYI